MSTEIINFLTTKFTTALKGVQKGDEAEFPLREIFQDISLVLEMKVSSSIPIHTVDTLTACLYMFNDAITECRMLSEARRRRSLARYTPKEWYQIQKIKGQLLKTMKDLQSVTDADISRSTSTTVGGTTTDKQITGLLERSEVIYGFNERMEDIVTSLQKKGESGINPIGIVGMGGSGKTALCKLVYNHQVVKRDFIPRIWVSLPNTFESRTNVTRSIAEYMLKELGAVEEEEDSNDEDKESELEEEKEDGTNSASLDELLVTLHKHLSGRKYLIVFDNVWDVTVWYEKLVNMTQMSTQQGIPRGLPKGYGGGIIISSRLEEDVKEMVGEENLHRPPMLDQEDSFSVFLDVMKYGPIYISEVDEMDSSMKTEIVENCNGLPSAAETLGQIFYSELLKTKGFAEVLYKRG